MKQKKRESMAHVILFIKKELEWSKVKWKEKKRRRWKEKKNYLKVNLQIKF